MRGQVSGILSAYGNIDRELIIPVYQRNYDWRAKHCDQLLEDLVSLSREKRSKHFFGSVVGDPESSFRWVVIDGQQRLTTVSLLMLALARLIDDGTLVAREQDLAGKIRRNYLVREEKTGAPRFRLKPVKNDAEAYRRLFAQDADEVEASSITTNYRHFLTRLPQLGLTGDEIWAAVQGLEVMILDLDPHDDAQRIFESLNSTGLALSEADKVRNLVLMGLESQVQEQVYMDYWNRIEDNVAYKTSEFLRWFLVTVTGKTPKLADVYEAFKSYAKTVDAEGAELLAPVRSHSSYFRDIQDASTGHPVVDQRLRRLNLMHREVILPLLMPMVAELEAGTITPDDFAASIEIIESYLFRRLAVGRASNALNGIFATLYREIARTRVNGTRFADALTYALRRRSGSGEFPSDEDFVEGFRTANFYRLPAADRRYLFERLENGNSKDVRDIAGGLESGNLSVEHIMPQTLTPEWRRELGPEADRIHAQWLHRIGNLTVTGYNSKYSNASFHDKKSIQEGFDSSPFRLNQAMKSHTTWDEASLEARTSELVQKALAIWPLPSTSFEPPRAQLPVEPLGQDTSFKGRTIVAYEFQGRRQVVDSWRSFAVQLLQDLLEIDRLEVMAVARTSDAYRVEGQPLPDNAGKNFVEIEPGLHWNLWSDTMTKVNALRRMLDATNIDPDDVTVTLRPIDEDTTTGPSGEESESAYSAVVKYAPLVEQLTGADATSSDVALLASEFQEAFGPYVNHAPLETLGMAPRKFAADPSRLATASADQVLAMISSVILETHQLDPDALKEAITDGALATQLRRLVEVG